MDNKIKVNVHQEPIYEKVQVGTNDVTTYETTDGKRFYNEDQAKEHQDWLDAKEFAKTNLKSYQTKPPFLSSHGCWYRLNSYRDLYLAHHDNKDYGDSYEVYVDGNPVGELDFLLENQDIEAGLKPNWYLIFTRYNQSNDWVISVHLTSKERAIENLNESVNSFVSQIPK